MQSVIYAVFFGWEEGPVKVWGSNFWGTEQTFNMSKALKFSVIFKKYALKLIKIWEIIGKISEKWSFS